MPNQRAPNKKQFGITFDKNLVDEIAAYCERNGMTRTDFLRRAAEYELEQKKRANNNKKVK